VHRFYITDDGAAALSGEEIAFVDYRIWLISAI